MKQSEHIAALEARVAMLERRLDQTDRGSVRPGDVLLTSDQAAAMTSTSVRTIWRMVERGQFPAPMRYNRRLVRWVRRDIEAWLDRQTVPGAVPA